MGKQQVSMTEHSCDSRRCKVSKAVPEEQDAPPGWYVGEAARVDEHGEAEPVEWVACQARHISGAIQAVTGSNGDGEPSDDEPGTRRVSTGREDFTDEAEDDDTADDLDDEDAEDDLQDDEDDDGASTVKPSRLG
jgi:hypothetical protein